MPVQPCLDCGREVSTLATACPHCGRPSNVAAPSMAAPRTEAAIREQTLWSGSPSWSLLIGRLVMASVTLIVIPLIARFASSAASDFEAAARLVKIGWWVTAILVAAQLGIFLVRLFRLRSTLYTITNQRVMIETGLFTKTLNEIDLRYIDDSQFFQGVMDRVLGIGNVTLVSSDKTSPLSVLHGIRDPRGVREMIRTNAYQVSQRQLFTRAT